MCPQDIVLTYVSNIACSTKFCLVCQELFTGMYPRSKELFTLLFSCASSSTFHPSQLVTQWVVVSNSSSLAGCKTAQKLVMQISSGTLLL